jgi:hypothetical protein
LLAIGAALLPEEGRRTGGDDFRDYEVIVPPHKLLHVVTQSFWTIKIRPGAGALVRVCDGHRMLAARHRSQAAQKQVSATRHAILLFHAAHDIKGGGDLRLSASRNGPRICRLIEHTPDMTRVPLPLID